MEKLEIDSKSFLLFMGDRIKRLRIDNTTLTQEQLADELGLSAATIIRIETGKTEMKIRTAFKLARKFGVSLDDLTGYTIDEDDQPTLVSESKSKYGDVPKTTNIIFHISDSNNPDQKKFQERLGRLLLNQEDDDDSDE